MTREKTFAITIDNRRVDVRQGLTILEAARKHAIYIPSLCALEGLPPFGGCRMCIVEVDGLRGFPTACTTPVEEGMVIRTDSAEIKALRQEILKLILSEHPASCLFCGEKEACVAYQGTIRKAGMTTGCRYCPNDGRCELQQITEKVGLADSSYPVLYRGVTVEKEDPFYDRDYNLCVLCGRCVRICNSVRMNGTLSFKQRGKLTTIGAAFERSHLEGGCEFCGACVSVCPTGALSVKTSKWYGKPEAEAATTCPFCAVGCRLMVQVKHGRVIDVLPDYASFADEGLLCVKGRFAVPELAGLSSRPTEPRELTPAGYEVVSWERAVAKACEKLSSAEPRDVLMVLSTQLTNEDLFAAQQFSRQVVKGEQMASIASMELGDAFARFLEVACSSDGLDAIDRAGLIVCVGFDSRYGYSPIGVRVKKAVERGARLVTLAEMETNLDLVADLSFKVEPAQWAGFLRILISPQEEEKRQVQTDSIQAGLFALWRDEIERTRTYVTEAASHVIIAGPGALAAPGRGDLLTLIGEMRQGRGWKTVSAHSHANISGMVAMGALPGVKPGEALRKGPDGQGAPPCDIERLDTDRRFKVVYAIGEARTDRLPPHDFLIYQNAVPPLSGEPDLILPSTLFTECSGTVFTMEGRLATVEQAVDPAGRARPDWWILARIAEGLGRCKIGYTEVRAVQAEIRKYLKSFPETKKKIAFAPLVAAAGSGVKEAGAAGRPGKTNGEYSFLLYVKGDPETYRGMPLSDAVPGMKRIGDRGFLLVNADDAAKLGLEENGVAEVGSDGVRAPFPVRVSASVNTGVVHLIAAGQVPFPPGPCAVTIRRTDE